MDSKCLPEVECLLPALAAPWKKYPSTTAPKYLANHSPLGISLLYDCLSGFSSSAKGNCAKHNSLLLWAYQGISWQVPVKG